MVVLLELAVEMWGRTCELLLLLEVEMCTVLVGAMVAMRGVMSGAILVGLTAAVGVLRPARIALVKLGSSNGL